MKEIITKATEFINENTMLLIGICAFLIIVLIVYLIDNGIKTKKMQKALTEMDKTEDKVITSSEPVKEEIKEETKFDSISLGDEETKPTEVEPQSENVEINIPIEETPVEKSVPTFNDIAEETPVVEQTPTIEETPVPEVKVETKAEEPKFTNKKSLSEILAKKKESINTNDTDKTLEETTEFNNTF